MKSGPKKHPGRKTAKKLGERTSLVRSRKAKGSGIDIWSERERAPLLWMRGRRPGWRGAPCAGVNV